MRGPASLSALSGEMLAWVRAGGRPTRGDWRHRLLLPWQSFWFERHRTMSRRLGHASAPPSTDPVFILGMWRSGTTLLHELLGACPALIAPTTWQCLHPSVFRLRRAPAGARSAPRPMDGLAVTATSPQEDEFALLALGVPSVYRGFLDPRRLPELSAWLDPAAWSVAAPPGWLELWQEFLVDVAGEREGRLLLKSPSHTFRLRALTQAFPGASYVWIVREPTELWRSNLEMWRSMFRTYALWDWDEATLAEFLTVVLQQAARCLAIAVAELPPERLVVLELDRLTRSPLESARAVNARLGLAPWADMAEPIARRAKQLADHRRTPYAGAELSPRVQGTLDALRVVQERALGSHGLDGPSR